MGYTSTAIRTVGNALLGLSLALVLVAAGGPARAQTSFAGWTPVPQSGSVIGVTTLPDGKILGIGTNYYLYTRATLTSAWVQVSQSCCVIGVTAMTDGKIVGIGTDKLLYTRATLTSPWAQVPQSGSVIGLTMLPDGKILGIGSNYYLYTRATLTSPWAQVANSCCVIGVTAMPDGKILGIGTNNFLYTRTTLEGPWAQVPQSGSVIGVTTLRDGTILGIGTNKLLYTSGTSPPVQAQAPVPSQVQPQIQPQVVPQGQPQMLSPTPVPQMVATGLPSHQLRKHSGTGSVSGDGPGAVAWLIGDINGDGKKEVIQPWANGNMLGMIVYGTDDAGNMTKLWGTSRVSGDGPGAVAWLIGDINGDGKDEVIQQWANGNKLGTLVYGTTGPGYAMQKLWGTSSVSGDGPVAVAWLIGDLNGDGKDEVIQQWASKGNILGTIVYGTTGPGHAMTKLWGTSRVSGDGAAAVAWLIGDINGDGKDEVVQQWASKGNILGTIVYGTTGPGHAMTKLWGTSRVSGDGAGAVKWLIGDINGDGKKEVIQQWANGKTLGTIVYGTPGPGHTMTKLWGTSRVSGDGPGAVAWLIGDINGDGKDEVIQQWANGDKLGTLVYGTPGPGHTMTKLWGTSSVSGDGPGAVAWLIGDINGDGRDEVIQQWKNGSVLGTIAHKAPYDKVPANTDTDDEKAKLLKDHAPLIWLAKDEAYFPSSVEWAFQGLMRFRNTTVGDGNYWLRTKAPLSSPSDESLPLFKGNRNLAGVPVYAFWTDKGEYLDLVYWTYYPYNRGKAETLSAVGTGVAAGALVGCYVGGPVGCVVGAGVGYVAGEGVSAAAGPTIRGNHVSDWEHITVRLAWVYDKKTKRWSRNVQSVYIQAHDFGGAYYWSSLKKEGGTHPIVYSAWGSHGYYATPGEQKYRNVPELVDLTSEGTKWMTWANVLTYDYSASKGLGGSAWPSWMSKDTKSPGVGDPSNPASGGIWRWGNPEQSGDNCLRTGIPNPVDKGKTNLDANTCRLENGPVGPAHKSEVWNPALLQ